MAVARNRIVVEAVLVHNPNPANRVKAMAVKNKTIPNRVVDPQARVKAMVANPVNHHKNDPDRRRITNRAEARATINKHKNDHVLPVKINHHKRNPVHPVKNNPDKIDLDHLRKARNPAVERAMHHKDDNPVPRARNKLMAVKTINHHKNERNRHHRRKINPVEEKVIAAHQANRRNKTKVINRQNEDDLKVAKNNNNNSNNDRNRRKKAHPATVRMIT